MSKLVKIAAVSVGVIVAAGLFAGSSDTPTTNTATTDAPKVVSADKTAPEVTTTTPVLDDAAKNVTMGACEVEPTYGTVTVPFTINNPTSKASDYMLEVRVTDKAGVEVGTANAYESNVASKATRKAEAFGSAQVDGASTGPYTCALVDVTRTENY
jgi:hypothetical protein